MFNYTIADSMLPANDYDWKLYYGWNLIPGKQAVVRQTECEIPYYISAVECTKDIAQNHSKYFADYKSINIIYRHSSRRVHP
jgi:hypothetical protein